jgi:siroheme synthase
MCRGGEEVVYLQQHGIQVHAVPGITAAAGICAELGIPMTHRGMATSVRFLTGHSRDGGEAQLDDTIAACADPNTTLVVYMGLSTLPSLTSQLSSHGFDLDTPAVAVERGTTAAQRVVYGTLRELHAAVTAARLKSPTLIIIGQVVALAPGWQVNREGTVQPGADCTAWQGQCARQLLPDVVGAVLPALSTPSSSSSRREVAVPAAAAGGAGALQVPAAGAAV